MEEETRNTRIIIRRDNNNNTKTCLLASGNDLFTYSFHLLTNNVSNMNDVTE